MNRVIFLYLLYRCCLKEDIGTLFVFESQKPEKNKQETKYINQSEGNSDTENLKPKGGSEKKASEANGELLHDEDEDDFRGSGSSH